MTTVDDRDPPAVTVSDATDKPMVKVINSDDLKAVGAALEKQFREYVQDRFIIEQKWLRNLRQYLGVYDPEIEKELSDKRSKAYPKLTRVKCISVLSRIMNLMFPGNERNWTLNASPSPDMKPEDIQKAVQDWMAKNAEGGVQNQQPDEEDIEEAVEELARSRAEELVELIDDQLQEIGGDQTLDYVHLNRKVVASGIIYGIGVLRGPFVRTENKTKWGVSALGQFEAKKVQTFKPQYEFVPCWDFYPDLSAKTLNGMDGYFLRLVMSRNQVRELAKRDDFNGDVIKEYLKTKTQGNYKAQPFESELRVMGIKINVNEQKAESQKFEVIVWNGPLPASQLKNCGVDVPEANMADDIESEVWLLDGNVIKADMNPWRKLGVEKMRTIHPFLFDEDDTSPIGNGLPNVMRDSQMSINAAARMLMDNASVTCGPNLELNMELLLPNQDTSSTAAYKMWYREGTGQDAQFPAVRNVTIDGHLPELMKIVEMWMKFADQETFVGPATGGDMERGPSEPMRTAAGASMLRGDAALPFKDIIRNFDTFTQSVIMSLVWFNRKFNPGSAAEGDYDVIARGATSLIAKEVRGMQLDQLAAQMTPEDWQEVDRRKFLKARMATRDLEDMLVSDTESERRGQQAAQQAQEAKAAQDRMLEANVRKLLSDAFKNIAQGQKNSAASDATTTNTALQLLEAATMEHDDGPASGATKPSSRSN